MHDSSIEELSKKPSEESRAGVLKLDEGRASQDLFSSGNKSLAQFKLRTRKGIVNHIKRRMDLVIERENFQQDHRNVSKVSSSPKKK